MSCEENVISRSGVSLTRHHLRFALALLVLMATAAAFSATTASASKQAFAYFGAEIDTGTMGGEFSLPGDVAVNSSGAGPAEKGDVYVIDASNQRIQRFGQDDNGTPSDPYDDTFPFISAWGAGVDSVVAGTGYEICTVASSCAKGIPSGVNGALSGPGGIAVDQDTGFVYVTDLFNLRMSVYGGDGAFLRSFGWDVVQSGPGDTGTGYEICVAANGDTCKAGVSGNGTGQLAVSGTGFSGAGGIAVSLADGNMATGTVYLADGRNHRVNTYNLDGGAPASFGSAANFQSEFGPAPEHVVVDSRGIVYATDRENDSEIERYDSLNANGNGVGFLAPIAAQTIRVSGGPGNGLGSTPYAITFTGLLGRSDVSQLTVSDGSTPLSGGAGASVTTTTPGGPGADEVQKVMIAATAGQFRLTFNGQTTGDIPFDAFQSEVRNALEALSSVPPAPLVNSQRKGLEIDPDSDGPGPGVDTLYVVRDSSDGTTVVQQFGPVNAPGLTVPPSTQDDAHGAVAGFNTVEGLGLDTSSGRLFVSTASNIGGPAGPGGKDGVYVLDDASATPPSISLDSVSGITATSATVNATVNPNGGPLVTYRLEYSLDGANWKATPEVVIGTQESPQTISAELSPLPIGLQPATSYQVRLRVIKAFTSSLTSSSLTFTTLTAPPVVETTGAPVRTTTSAQLGGRVTPRNSATTYFFEYGTQGACDANPCAQTASQPAGTGSLVQLVSEEISGLEPNTAYHYRVVADNGQAGSPVFGEDMTVTTPASDAPLSHGRFPGPPGSDRAWEQVSPPEAGGNPVSDPAGFSADGNRALYEIAGGTPLAEEGNIYSPYFSERTAGGWQAKPILPPRSNEIGNPHWYLRSDASLSTVAGTVLNEASFVSRVWRLDPLGAQATKLAEGIKDDVSLVSTWVSDDGSRFMAFMRGPQDPEHPTSEEQFYDLTSGAPRLASILPDGSVPACGIREGQFAVPSWKHLVSADGSRLFFTSRGTGDCNSATRAYVRDLEAGQTTLISPPPASGPECDVVFISSNPEKAFFWTKSRLVGEDTYPGNCAPTDRFDGDIYGYELDSGTLSCVTCAASEADVDVYVNGPFRVWQAANSILVAEDGSRVYFQSPHALVPGAAEIDKEGGSTYRLEVASGDLALVTGAGIGLSAGSAAATPDASTILFRSAESSLNPLGGTENAGAAQYYRYDDEDRSLVCISCPADGSPPRGAVLAVRTPFNQGLTQISNDGETIAFATPTPLLGIDQNTSGTEGSPENGIDVYEWRDGRNLLVTDGLANTVVGTEGPSIAGISDDGRDIFFIVAAQYTPDALDGYRRLYDARLGGGFEYPKPSPPCPLEVCQGIPKGPPEEQAPGTGAFAGPGNVNKASRAKKCAKGKARRKGRCVAKKTKKKSAQSRANRNRRSAR